MKRRFYGDPAKAAERWRLKKQKRAGTDPETQAEHAGRMFGWAAFVSLILSLFAWRDSE